MIILLRGGGGGGADTKGINNLYLIFKNCIIQFVS
jgi:hypothetical protein